MKVGKPTYYTSQLNKKLAYRLNGEKGSYMLDEDLWLYHLYTKEQEACLLCKIDRYFTTKADLENYLIEFSYEYFKRFPGEDEMNQIYVENARGEKVAWFTKLELMKGVENNE